MKEQDARDFPMGQPADIVMNGDLLATNTTIEPVTQDQLNKDYLDALKFMEEKIEIIVQDSSDPNADNPVPVGVNGIFRYFKRGVPIITERKFVDALLVKNSSVSTPEFINGGGERAFKIVQKNALKYPIQLLRDNNPKGIEWLRQRMAQTY